MLSISMTAALRTFSSSWLLASAFFCCTSARSASISVWYFARTSLTPTHTPTGTAVKSVAAAVAIMVIMSQLIHVSLV